MKPGSFSRQTVILSGLYAFYAIVALLNILAGPRYSPPLVTPIVMALAGIAAILLTYEMRFKTIGAIAGILVFLFFCQALGANSGFPFGDFAYSSQLGPKVFDVPVIMPFAVLSFLVPAWVAADKVLRYRNAVVAAIIVTAFDAVLELAADSLDLWHWRGGSPTELNYISWFGVSYVVFTILQKYATEKEQNPLVPHLLFAQLLCFALTDAGLRFLIRH